MKTFCAFTVVLAVSLCSAQESTTSSTSNVTSSGIEKEDLKKKQDNLPVRMMQITNYQPVKSDAQSNQPAGSSPRNSRTSWNHQASTPKPDQTSRGHQARQMLPRNPSQNENRPAHAVERDPTNPATGFGYRAVWGDDRGMPHPLNTYREDEAPPTAARSANPSHLPQRQPTGEYGMPSRTDTGGDDSQNDFQIPQYMNNERQAPPSPAINSPAFGSTERGVGYQYNPSFPTSDFGGNRQPDRSQDSPMNPSRNNPLSFGGYPIYAQPRDSLSPESDNRLFPAGQGPRPGHDGTWTNYRTYGMGSRDDNTVLYQNPSEPHQHRPYSFNYISESDDGMHGHQQSADESGRVVGSYSISLGDGRRRIVEYIADENGFRANIDSNEHGTDFNVNPADVTYYNTPGSANVLPGLGAGHDQNQRRNAVVRPTPNAIRFPSHRSQDSPNVAAETSAQERPEENARLPPNLPRELLDVPRYGAQPFPVRRRMPEPQDADDSPSDVIGSSVNHEDSRRQQRNQDNQRQNNRQARRQQSPQPAAADENVPENLGSDDSPRVPITRAMHQPSQPRRNFPVNDQSGLGYDESPRFPTAREMRPPSSSQSRRNIPSLGNDESPRMPIAREMRQPSSIQSRRNIPSGDQPGLDESSRMPISREMRQPSSSQSRRNIPIGDQSGLGNDESPRMPSAREMRQPSSSESQTNLQNTDQSGSRTNSQDSEIGQPSNFFEGSPAESSFMGSYNSDQYDSGNRFWFRRST